MAAQKRMSPAAQDSARTALAKQAVQKEVPVDYEGMDPEMAETLKGEQKRIVKVRAATGGLRGGMFEQIASKLFGKKVSPTATAASKAAKEAKK